MQTTEISLSRINIDTNNPRNNHGVPPKSIEELAESIKSVGLLSPLVVRQGDKKGTYIIVCGQRRYMALNLLKSKTVPCIVKEFANENEILEAQIIENLQRENVHPVQEAITIKLLLQNNSFDEVAVKLGKSIYFVRQRNKLNDLIPEWQQFTMTDNITMANALRIAQLDADAQMDIYKDEVEGCTFADGEKVEITNWVINKHSYSLADVPFADMKCGGNGNGTCDICPFNTAYAQLFPDAKAMCTNKDCFKSKWQLWIKAEVKDIMDNRPDVVLVASYDTPAEIEARAKFLGVHSYLESKEYSTVTLIDEPNFEEYKKAMDEDEQYDTYDEMMEDYNEDLDSFTKQQEDIKNCIIKPAFNFMKKNANGHCYIMLKNSSNNTITEGDTTDTDSADFSKKNIESEIARIKYSSGRKREINENKEWDVALQFFADEQDLCEKREHLELSNAEVKAFYLAVKKALPWNKVKLFDKYFSENKEGLDDDSEYTIQFITRLFIYSTLPPAYITEGHTDTTNVLMSLVHQYDKPTYDEVRATAIEAETKRLTALEKKLTELNEKLENLC